MKKLTNNHFYFKSDELNQFLRGKMYILLDSVLMYKQPLLEDELELAERLFKAFLELFIWYLKCLPSYFEKVRCFRIVCLSFLVY